MAMWITMSVVLLLIPAMMAGIGVLFQRRPPKKINGWYGYRTSRSMASQEAWDFAHRACGRLWLRWGIAMAVISLLLMLPVLGAGEERLAWWSGSLTLLQCVVMMLSIFPVERELKRNFDRNGHRITKENQDEV